MYTKISVTTDESLDVVLVTIVTMGTKIPEMTADIAFIASFFFPGAFFDIYQSDQLEQKDL